MTPSPSRSHCTAAPVMKIDPSRAYSTVVPSVNAIVVTSPCCERGASAPVCSSTNDPVPYVFLLEPSS